MFWLFGLVHTHKIYNSIVKDPPMRIRTSSKSYWSDDDSIYSSDHDLFGYTGIPNPCKSVDDDTC